MVRFFTRFWWLGWAARESVMPVRCPHWDMKTSVCVNWLNPSRLQQRTFAASPFSDPFTVKISGVIRQPQEDPEMLWVMGPVLAVILIIIIVIAILLFKRWVWHTQQRTLRGHTLVIFGVTPPTDAENINRWSHQTHKNTENTVFYKHILISVNIFLHRAFTALTSVNIQVKTKVPVLLKC